MLIFKILMFIFLVPGFVMVFFARNIVARYNLDKNAKCEFENEMNEEEIKQYKFNKTVVNFKMLGMLVALPGLILLLISFK